MFGLGVWDTIKLCVGGAVVIGILLLAWDYKHTKEVVAKQKEQIASLEQQKEIVAKLKKNFEAFSKKTQETQRKVAGEKQTNQEVGQSGNPDVVVDRMHYFQLRGKGGVQGATNGRGGGARPAPARPANP